MSRFWVGRLWIGFAMIGFIACSPSAFERQHDRAVRENPSGVKLEIRPRANQHVFAASETLLFEELYTAKYPGMWHIEVLDGWNDASTYEDFNLSDGKSVWREHPIKDVVCCHSRHVWLSHDPTRIPYKRAPDPEDYLSPPREWREFCLPKKPGKYQLYVATERVFGLGYSLKTYQGRGQPVTSNVFNFEVK